MSDAWARVRRELTCVSAQTPERLATWAHTRARKLLRHHARSRFNSSYRELLEASGIGLADDELASVDWKRLPIVDKGWLAQASYSQRPSCRSPTLTVSTSGSTSSQVFLPVTTDCANRGLGDNFLRALLMSGAGPDDRHWGIEHRLDREAECASGSSISMTWLARNSGRHALVTVATDPLDEQLRRAADFAPHTISGSPGFLKRIARSAGRLRPQLLLYGGAALSEPDEQVLREAFPEARLTAFYPTTDAGALGTAPLNGQTYRTFTETHLVEVLDEGGEPVTAGSCGNVVVTQFDALAAPIIRYQIGDRATFHGWSNGRLLLSGIERTAEAAIGSTLVPFSDLRMWTARLATRDPSIVAVQLLRRHAAGDHREQAVVRVIGGHETTELAAHARALLDDFPHIAAEIASGELAPAAVQFCPAPDSLADCWKIPPFVDEPPRQEAAPCPSI